MKHKELKNKALEKSSVQKEYKTLEPEFSLLREMLRARKKIGLSQAQIAERMGTKSPAITRQALAIFGNNKKICRSVRLSFRNKNCSELTSNSLCSKRCIIII